MLRCICLDRVLTRRENRTGMKRGLTLICAVSTILFTGCTTNLYLRSGTHEKFEGGAGAVYVSNPELKNEYRILQRSEIYQLTNSPVGNRRLTLEPLGHGGGCGNPIILSIYTLGIIPSSPVGGRFSFQYEIESNGTVEHRAHYLAVYERFSLWERFIPHNDNKVLGKALRRSILIQPNRL